MDLGIAIVVCMTSWFALLLNEVTDGLPLITEFFCMLATAGSVMTVVHFLIRAMNISGGVRPRFHTRRLVFAGVIGILSGKLVIITFCLFLEPDQFWVILWLMTFSNTTIVLIMRRACIDYIHKSLER